MLPPYWIPIGQVLTEHRMLRYENCRSISFTEVCMNEIKPGKYRHFKDGEYELLAIATHSETLEPMVVYRALYGKGELWVRPAAMWSEIVENENYRGPRFLLIEEQEKCL